MMKHRIQIVVSLMVCVMFSLNTKAQEVSDCTVTTVLDKGTSGVYFATFCPSTDVAIDILDADVFSIYTDGPRAMLCQLRRMSGFYNIKAGDAVVIKTLEEKEVKIKLLPTTPPSSILWTDLICPNEDITIESFKKETSLGEDDTIYLLTNMAKNGGFGFTKFTGDLMKRGNFYIVVTKNKTRAAKDIEDGDPVPFLEGEAGNDDGFTAQGIDAKVKLSKTKASIEKGKTLTLKATITPSDLPDKSVTWKSSDTKIATVTSAGKVKGVKAGTATITCTSNSTGAKATCKVTVGYVKLNKTEVILEKGKTMTLKAAVYPSTLEDKSVTWKSSNKKVATVTSKGKVKGVKAGSAVITCTSNATGLKTTCEVTVGYVKLDQTEVTVNKGKTVTLKAVVYPSTLEDRSVTWESSNTKVATVTSKGKVKGIKAGTVTITCTSNATGLSTTCIVTVTTTASILSLEGDGKDGVTEINEVEASAAIKPFDVFDLSGHKVLHQVTSLEGLPDGIYIVNGKKILKK